MDFNFKGFYDEIIFDVDRSILKSYTGKQGDTKSRGLYVTVTQKNAVIEDLTGLSMRFFYEKPDKTRGFIDGVVDGNKFRIDYTNQMYAVPGVVKAELRLMGADGEIITAKTFKILVDGSIADGSIVSENERGILDRAFELAEDIIPRLELLDVELLEDVQDEMLGARHSNTKDETYESLGARLEASEQDLLDHKAEYASNRQQDQLKVAKVEKELNDYKATMQQININQEPKQKATGYGIISLPPNAANGQVSGIKIEGLTATNLINGRGDNLEGWTNITGDLIIEDNFFKHIGSTGKRDSYPIQVRQGDKLYLSYFYKTTGTPNCDHSFRLFLGETQIQVIGFLLATENVNKELTRFSLVSECEGDADNIGFRPYNPTSETGHWYFKHIMLINLTQAFGAGNEPTKEECDQIFANYFDGTKSTIGCARVKSIGKNLINESEVLIEHGFKKTHEGYVLTNNNKVLNKIIWKNENMSYKGQIAVGINAKSEGALIGSFPQIIYSDGTETRVNYIANSGFNTKHVISQSGKIVDKIIWKYGGWDSKTTIKHLMISKDINSEYEPYIEDRAYVTAVKDGKIVDLKSLPNRVADEISLNEGKAIIRIGVKTNIASDTIINYTDMADGGQFVAYYEDGTQQVGIKGDTLKATATTLIYQLAEPIEIPVQVSGSIVSYPNGTIYIERILPDAGVYTDKITILHQDAPIKRLDRLSKVDFYTGVETELDVSEAVIAEDKLSFTHPDLSEGDIVFFEYEYDVESTEGETEVEYYDSRYVVKDDVTGKFYKWNVKVSNGTPTIEVVEV